MKFARLEASAAGVMLACRCGFREIYPTGMAALKAADRHRQEAHPKAASAARYRRRHQVVVQ